MGKSDAKSASRILPLSRKSWLWLIMKARDPRTNQWCYFVEKCLLFRASISCAHFQRFLNALCHLAKYKSGSDNITNYLDEFLFMAYLKCLCNAMIQAFLDLCAQVGVPIAMEKTKWAVVQIIFLGLLLDGRSLTLAVPVDKRDRAIDMLNKLLHKKKATMGELQTLCGFLNFLNKAVFPGRTFTRRMYSKFSGIMDIKMIPDRENRVMEEDRMLTSSSFKLKKHHHVRLDAEFKLDCEVWLSFLTDKNIYNAVSRNMEDLLPKLDGNIEPSIRFTSDASALPQLGYGCMFDNKWMYGKWDEKFITDQEPSIEYLELFALTAGVLTWSNYMTDCTMTVHCENVAVIHMINKLTSSFKNCMFFAETVGLKWND